MFKLRPWRQWLDDDDQDPSTRLPDVRVPAHYGLGTLGACKCVSFTVLPSAKPGFDRDTRCRLTAEELTQ